MKVLRICVGTPVDIEYQGKSIQTSIFKTRVEGSILVRSLNIDGDRQSDLTDHGGRNKAIYVYSDDDYDYWNRKLGVLLDQDSQFGENLTVSGDRDEQVLIGSRYRLGDTEVTVTQPRIPCFKLGIRWNDKTFPRRFWSAGRLGFYLRVEKEGLIERDQSLTLVSTPEHGFTVRKLYEVVKNREIESAESALNTLPHLDDGWIRRLRKITDQESRAQNQLGPRL